MHFTDLFIKKLEEFLIISPDNTLNYVGTKNN